MVISGKGGSGKTYTTLNSFDNLKEITQNKKICFCAPTNSVVESNKKYKVILEKYFKNVEFITTSSLLGEKCVYDENGVKSFIINNKFIKLDKYDIIIIDEISMVNDTQIDYIVNNNKNSLILLLGDKNQLDPVNSSDTNILDNYNINLVKNMRCDKVDINKINEFIINSIESFNNNYFTFINEFYKLIYKLKNNNTIYVVHTLEELSDLYIELYKNDVSIIGNYKNETCDKINEKIKEKILFKNGLNCIDNYFIGQQVVFLEQYENYNTSDFDTLLDIKIKKYEYELIDYNIFIKNVENIHIDSKTINDKFNKIKESKCEKVCNDFTIEDKILYIYQKIFNYLLNISNTVKEFKKIIKEFNNYDTIYINSIKLKNNRIKVLNSKYIKTHELFYNSIKNKINNLNKSISSFKGLKIKKFYNDFIIQTLYYLLDKYRNDIFAKISSAFSCTIHRLQGCSINNMFVNVEDIFRMTEKINKLKCLYTATSRASDKLIIYTPIRPVCNCGVFVKEIYDNKENINILMCRNKKKCGFFEDKCINNSNCKQCINCSKIYYKHMFNEDTCYLCI